MRSFCQTFNIDFPVVQGGMIWCSGWRLASAVSEAGGLGILGAGSMHPEILSDHIAKCQQATGKPFGVNLPLMYPQIDELIQIIISQKVPVVITSAGSPAKYTEIFHNHGIKVMHVVSNLKFALKSQQAGVDAVIAEGFEAGGHNGSEETTTLVLLQLLRPHISIPLLAAGGIGTGSALLAAMALGADGVQIGSLFAASAESSAHDAFKKQIIDSVEGDTRLSFKSIGGVRLLKNRFSEEVRSLEISGALPEELQQFLGHGRAKKGMFEGDMEDGELEIGQIAAAINHVATVREIMERLRKEFYEAKSALCKLV